jgi:hypothetical protein
MDQFRKHMRANPAGTLALIDDLELARHKLILNGSFFKRMEIPAEIPARLKPWYTGREIYVGKYNPDWQWAFSDRVLKEVRKDFRTLAPLYQLLRGYVDELQQ